MLLLVGLGLALVPWSGFMPVFFGSAVLAEVLKEIGEAFLIAFVLAIVVGSAEKLKLLDEFAEHISLHIMGRKLPRQLRDHVEQYLGATFVRPKMYVTYRIEAWDGKLDRVRLRKEIRYQLENCSEDEVTYEWQYRIDDSWFPDVTATIDRMRKSTPKTENKFQEYTDQELEKKITSEAGGRRFREKLPIPGNASGDSGSVPKYEFIADSTECFPSGHSEHLTATHPILFTELTVEYDKKQFDVSVYLPLADPNKAFQDPRGTETANGKFWRIQQPILPGQSFFTIWKLRNPAPAPAAAANPLASPTQAPPAS
ncbi:MAG: hypothetical protein JOZ32_21515 [Bryobacterales bacterium]|nr:hypothetical protein [Bryobacterales bacterium]